jgi:hypothetical protein
MLNPGVLAYKPDVVGEQRTYAKNSPNFDFTVGTIDELPLLRVILRKS